MSLYDQGGLLPSGLTPVVNKTGRPEPVHDPRWLIDGTIGFLHGMRVIVTKAAKETDIYLMRHRNAIVCGSRAHLLYQIAKAQVRIDIRADLERQLDAFAKRVGVDRSTISE